MRITYIHHSSFLTEMKEAAFLFDYYQGEVRLPQGKPAVVFASHRHGDHFSKVIFDLAEGREDVFFVLSDDIWEKRTPPDLRNRILFAGPGQEFSLPWLSCVSVRTFKSTDEGVSFLIRSPEGVI